MSETVQEEKQVTTRDIAVKIKKLEGFIIKAERRIAAQERQLGKLRSKMKTEGKLTQKRVLV